MAQVFCFGDSITLGFNDYEKGGWVERLRSYLQDSGQYSELYNLGVSGDSTEDILKRFDDELDHRLDADEKSCIIFAIGVNDSQFIKSENKHRVSVEQYKKNLNTLIKNAKDRDIECLFVGLTPVDEEKTSPIPWNSDKSYSNGIIKKYDNALREICVEQHIPFVGVFDVFMKKEYKTLLDDGLHPDAEGHDLLFTLIRDALKSDRLP